MNQHNRRVPVVFFVAFSLSLLSTSVVHSSAQLEGEEHEGDVLHEVIPFTERERQQVKRCINQTEPRDGCIDIAIPHLPKLSLTGRIDSYSGRRLLESTHAASELCMPGDVISFSSFRLMILDTCHLVLRADARLFGVDAAIELDSVNRKAYSTQGKNSCLDVDRTVFQILFKHKPRIEALAGHWVTLEDAQLILEEGTDPVISAYAEIFNEAVQLTIALKEEGSQLRFGFDRLELAELDEALLDSEIGGVALSQLSFTTRYDAENKQATTRFEAQLDSRSLPGDLVAFELDDPQERTLFAVTGELSEQNRLSLVASDCVCQVPFLGSFTQAQLKIQPCIERSRLTDGVDYGIYVEAPGVFWFDEEQRVAYTLHLESHGDEFIIQGKLEDAVLLPKIVLEDGSFNINTDEEKVILSGSTSLGDMKTDAVVIIDVSKDGDPADISVSSGHSHKPYAQRPIANIEDIELSHFQGAIPLFDECVQLDGEATILGNRLPVTVEWSHGFGFAPIIKAALPEGSRFADFFPHLTGTSLGRLCFDNGCLVASTRNCQDEASRIVYQAGLTFYGDARFEGPLESLAAFTDESIKSVHLYGKIDSDHLKTTLVGPLPLSLPFINDVVKLGSVVYQVGADLNWLLATVGVKISDEDTIRFSGPLAITDRTIKGSLHAEQGWQQPCGLPRISFKDLKLDLELDAEKMRKRALPAKLELAMQLDFLDVPLQFTGVADNEFSSLIFKSTIRKIDLADLVYFLADRLSIPCERSQVPPLDLYGVRITCAPRKAQAGSQFYNQGVCLAGATTLLGQKIDLTAEASSEGCVGTGSMQPICDHGFRLSQSEDNGPEVRLAFREDEQSLTVTGRAAIEGLFDDEMVFMYETPEKLKATKMVSVGGLTRPVEVILEIANCVKKSECVLALDFKQNEREFYQQMMRELAQAADRQFRQQRAETQKAEKGARKRALVAKRQPRIMDRHMRALVTSIETTKKEIDELEHDIKESREKIRSYEETRGASRIKRRYEYEVAQIATELEKVQHALCDYEADYQKLKKQKEALSLTQASAMTIGKVQKEDEDTGSDVPVASYVPNKEQQEVSTPSPYEKLRNIELVAMSWNGRCEEVRDGVMHGMMVRYSVNNAEKTVYITGDMSKTDELFSADIMEAITKQHVLDCDAE